MGCSNSKSTANTAMEEVVDGQATPGSIKEAAQQEA
jgi:hypothetical protein